MCGMGVVGAVVEEVELLGCVSTSAGLVVSVVGMVEVGWMVVVVAVVGGSDGRRTVTTWNGVYGTGVVPSVTIIGGGAATSTAADSAISLVEKRRVQWESGRGEVVRGGQEEWSVGVVIVGC